MKELKLDHYYLYNELTDSLKTLASEYDSLSNLLSIGTTVKNRNLWVMEITNFNTGPPESKPAIWIDGNTHAGEVMGSMVCLKTIWYLLTNYSKNPFITEMIDRTTFYILPRIDADGGEFVLTTPYYVLSADNETGGGRWYPLSEEEWRSSQHGLYLEDIDEDSFIVHMRISDPLGEWKISENDSRIMLRRAPEDNEGDFYRVYPEGLILNYHGEKEIEMAPARWSLNFNRNWPGEWAKEEISRGSGPYPLSEPETRAVADFIVGHINICIAITYHTHGGILFSYSENNKIPIQDRKLFKIIESIFQDKTGYPSLSLKQKDPSGSFSTYMTIHRAIPCTTVEIWDLLGEAGMGNWVERSGNSENRLEERSLKLINWCDRELDGNIFIDWHKFDHPQLGLVEIGGWKKKFLLRNPPVTFMEAEIDKIMSFPITLAKLLPKLSIKEASANLIGKRLYEVSVTIENKGAFPTYIMKHAVDIGSTKPVKVYLELGEGMKMISGNHLEKFHLEGFLNKILTSSRYERKNTRDKNKVTFNWIVESRKPGVIKICVESPKAGRDTITLKLASIVNIISR